MWDIVLTFLTVVCPVITGIVSWVIKVIRDEIKDLRKQFNGLSARNNSLSQEIEEHRLYSERNFTTKSDFKEMRTEIKNDMKDIKNEVVGALTRFETKLDQKADK